MIRICQIDNNGIYNGICYLYKDEKIRRISIWKDGKEVTLLKQFSDDIMTEYKNGHVVYEGGFLDSVIYSYPRNGVGEELDEDGKTRIFKGNYKNGKRHGRGSIYKNGMVCNETDWVMDYRINELWAIQSVIILSMLLFISLSFLVPWNICSYLLAVVLLVLSILWICQEKFKNQVSPVLDFENAVELFIEKFMVANNKDINRNFNAKELGRNVIHNLFSFLFFVWIIAGIIIIAKRMHYLLYEGPHGISYEQESYIVRSRYGDILLRFTITNYPNLKLINIGDECFTEAKEFIIYDLQNLQSLKIGSNSFTMFKNGFGNDVSKSFHIINCESLKSIEIGEYSFSDYGGQFELKNLSQLQSIQIGHINSNSYNFYSSSFIIQSNLMISNSLTLKICQILNL